MTDAPLTPERRAELFPMPSKESSAHFNAPHEPSNLRLLSLLPHDQMDSIMATDMCDIDSTFLGFVGIYERLAQIIPLDWTVLDLGCAYAPQAFFFAGHREYVGVDMLTELTARFVAPNSRHFHLSIAEFIEQHKEEYQPDNSFAICSYVPPWRDDNMRLVRQAFKNVFTFYPHAGKS